MDGWMGIHSVLLACLLACLLDFFNNVVGDGEERGENES